MSVLIAVPLALGPPRTAWSTRGPSGHGSRLNATSLELDASVAPGGTWIDAALDPTGDILWISNYEDTVTRIDLR